MWIFDVGEDGNCLFRAIAHQAYGNEEQHKIVRQKCMEYIKVEKEYFSSFVEGGKEQIAEYIDDKCKDGVWGDHIEIQAMSEIYDRPIEIYAYSNKPMKIFHENDDQEEPFRLSYHGESHYNAITVGKFVNPYIDGQLPPGSTESRSIEYALQNQKDPTWKKDAELEEQKQSQLTELQNTQDPQKIRKAIMASREDFDKEYQKQLDEVIEKSQIEQEIQEDEIQNAIIQSENDVVQNVI